MLKRWLAQVALLAAAAQGFAADDVTREALLELPHFVDEIRGRWEVPGAAVAVVKDGEVVYSGGVGLRDEDGGGAVSGRTVFAVGSTTKAFTAAAIGMLVEEGAVGLDRPVRDYIPELDLFDDHATGHLTVRDLLAHRSGIERHDAVWYRSGLGPPQLIERLRYLRPSADLRERFFYNNLMYVVAGEVVARVTAGTWEEFVRRRLFEPLAMARTSIGAPAAADQDVASPHGVDRDGAIVSVPLYRGTEVAAASGISSTADDMARWIRLLLGLGIFDGTRLMAESTVTDLFTPQAVVSAVGPREVPITTYGLGWFVESYRGRLMVSHTGSIDGFYSIVVLLPSDGLGVVVLTNRSQHHVPEVVSRWVVDRFLGLPEINWNARYTAQDELLRGEREAALSAREEQRRADTEPRVSEQSLAGSYRHPAYGDFVVEAADGGLTATFHGMTGPLEHFQEDVFLLKVANWGLRDEFVVRFQYAADGAVMSLSSTMQDGVPPAVFLRLHSGDDTASVSSP
jgi:CubicO group peptidase (beta-lactamase class C family)